MAEQTRERWRELCELAINESDPRRVAQLLHQLDQLLAEDEAQESLEPNMPSLQREAAAEPRLQENSLVPESGD